MNADGSGVQRLTTDGKSGGAAFSADGKRIVFASERDGDSEIYSMNAQGGEVRKVTDNTAANATPQLPGERAGGPWRVLVADDEPTLRLLCRVALEYDGFLVLEARDGIEALEVARLEKPDLILLDLMMPGQDGWRVATALKADETTSRIPIVFLSALAQTADRARGLEIGAIGYIMKPFDPLQLPATVRDYLEPADTPQRLTSETTRAAGGGQG